MTRAVGAVLGCIVSLSAHAVLAQVAPGKPEIVSVARAEVDPRFDAIQVVLRAEGSASAYFGPAGLPAGTRVDGLGAMLRFTRPLSDAEIEALRGSGVEWQERGGKVVRVGSVYGAFVPFRAVDTLRRHSLLLFAEVAWHPVTLQPLDQTVADVGGVRAQQLPRPVATGAGTVIGDIDSGVDVLHPHFFRADGGAFEWLDVDGDGELTPRVDAIDFDGDGLAGSNETVRVLDGAEVAADNRVQGDDDVLDVGSDWLYIDANQDGARNVGVEAGFTEFDPGYGEPAFVADDANSDGRLDRDERLLLLGSSKIQRFVTTGHTWRRGVDLIRAEQVPFINQIGHGSAVASIAAGGQPGMARVGVAPGADIVMYSSHMDAPGGGFEESGHLADLQDAVENGVDVLVHEWTNPSTAALDGSGNYEAAMQAAREAGVVHLNPLGNLNLSRKHLERAAPMGVEQRLGFVIGGGFETGGQVFPYSSVYGSLHWRAGNPPTVRLSNPLDEVVDVPLDGSVTAIGADRVQATLRTSARGTTQLQFTIWNPDSTTSVRPGDWFFELGPFAEDATVVGRIADFWSGWSLGVQWVDPTVGRGTAVYPATADAAIGVAAYGGRHELPEGTGAGELRSYSGRGPRIDGALLVHLAAPDDPFAAWGVAPALVAGGAGRSWFATFGGTSGATPHVAGAAALIRAADPTATPDDVEQRLLGTARMDLFTGDALPDPSWGAGKLDVFAAVHGVVRRPLNQDPIAVVELVGGTLRPTAEGSSDADDDALMFRWDFDYDGVWDSDWSSDPVADRVLEAGVNHVVRVDVRDEQGGRSGLARRFNFAAEEDAGFAPDALAEEDGDGLPPRPCGCSSAAEGSAWTGGIFFALLAARRRRRSLQRANRGGVVSP